MASPVLLDFLDKISVPQIVTGPKSFYIALRNLLLGRLKLKMEEKIFGDENAAKDPLLNDCYVEPTEVSKKAILKGRWGVGKSAIFFHKNQKLSDELAKNGEEDKLLWYIGEHEIDIYGLRHFRQELLEAREDFKRILEALWETRILCTEALLLYKLRKYYGSFTGKHWDLIAKIGEAKNSTFPIGAQIPDICVLFGLDKMGKDEWYKTILHQDQRIIRKNISNYLQACLKDINKELLQPIIVIEPIDTPYSKIEEQEGIAQILITALMNVYDRTFAPSENQRIQVMISVPWHLYNPESFDFPQRFHPYVGHIKWDSKTLRNFINQRIEWEFKRVKRSVKGDSDAWSMLFENSIANDNFNPRILEDSFFFLLRHTHHRPRDIQRLTRGVVEKYRSSLNQTFDEILTDRRTKIPSSFFRETIIETCPRLMRDEFLLEMRRKYSNIDDSLDLVRGLSIPFSEDDLMSRYRKKSGKKMSPDKLKEIVSQLWESGIIGVEITPNSERNIASMYRILPKEGYRKYVAGGKSIARWYLFDYNYDGNPIELRTRYENCVDDSSAGLVLHPNTFEYLKPRINAKCPLGV
jgi:hypothetical protein